MPNCELPALLRQDVLARWDGGTDGNAVGNDSGSSKSRNTHSQRRPYVWQGEVGLVAVPLEKQLAPAVLGARISRSAWVSEWRFSLNARLTDH